MAPQNHLPASPDDSGQMTENTPLLATPSCNSGLGARACAASNSSSSQRRHVKESKRRRRESASSVSSRRTDSDQLGDPEDHCPSPGLRSILAHSALSPTVDHSSEIWQSPTETIGKPLTQESLLGHSNLAPPHERHSLVPFLQRISLRLENSGSVARDHLASERTFLAYMRTSLAIVASGVALVQLFSAESASAPHGPPDRLHFYVRPLGASTVIVGLLILFIGVMRYFTVQVALTKGYFPVTRLATGFIAVMLTVLITLTFGILLAGKLEPKGK